MKPRTYLILSIAVFFAACSGTKPTDIGVMQGTFKVCPSSPNCVSTQATDDKHKMEPIAYVSDMETAKNKLIGIIKGMDRTQITEQDGNYIHAEFMSKTWKFVDDVEFFFDDTAKVIHFRSASRKGYSDMGVNRKRMTTITETFNK